MDIHRVPEKLPELGRYDPRAIHDIHCVEDHCLMYRYGKPLHILRLSDVDERYYHYVRFEALTVNKFAKIFWGKQPSQR